MHTIDERAPSRTVSRNLLRFVEGLTVYGSDGPCGLLNSVVMDHGTRSVTHIVVEPSSHVDGSSLVPIEFVASCASCVSLACTCEYVAKVTGVDRIGRPWPTRATSGRRTITLGSARSIPRWPPADGANTGSRQRASGPRACWTVALADRTNEVVGRVRGVIVDADDSIVHVLATRGVGLDRREAAIPIAEVTALGVHAVRLRVRATAIPWLSLPARVVGVTQPTHSPRAAVPSCGTTACR